MNNIKIISAGNQEIFDFAFPIGVGLIDSAINLTRLCLFDKPDFLIFIGTAGSYGNKKIFDIVKTSSASNIENCFFEKKCYFYPERHFFPKKSEEKINSMSHEEFCDEMIKFGLEAKKVGGVKNLVFRDIQ